MKTGARRFLSLISIALALVISQAVMGAQPALAMGSGSIFVGSCHAGSQPDIPSAITQANGLSKSMHKTITICPGTYVISAPLLIQTNNLTITGKKGAVITTPGAVATVFKAASTDRVTLENVTFAAAGGFTGDQIEFANSTNATVRNVTVLGGGTLAGASNIAIYFLSSSGKIDHNTILNWHVPTYGSSETAMLVVGTMAQTVRITNNTITDYEGRGLDVDDCANATISGNKVTGMGLNPDPVANNGIDVAGIGVGRITNNQVTGGALPLGTSTVGIELQVSKAIRITGNKVAHWNYGILLAADYAPLGNTNSNRITGNQVTETEFGITLEAEGGSGGNEHVDGNIVTGNKIVDSAAQPGTYGIQVMTLFSGAMVSTAKNETIKGNTISHFGTALTGMSGSVTVAPVALPYPAGNITGVFKPNTVH